MSHRLRIIVHDLPIMSVCVESIDRYFAEEHPQGQEIAIDNGDQLLENDYRLMIGMGKTFSRFGITFMLQCFDSELKCTRAQALGFGAVSDSKSFLNFLM